MTIHPGERPVLAPATASWDSAEDYAPVGADGHAEHSHDCHLFLYVPIGHCVIFTSGRAHHLSPSVGLWMPAGVRHSARFDDDCLITPLGWDRDVLDLSPTDVREVGIDGPRKRLLFAALRCEDDPAPDVAARLIDGPYAKLPLPQPQSRTAQAVAQALHERPDDTRTATEWAETFFASDTSLRRAFLAETGVTFTQWRTRLRLNCSLDLLAQGQLVSAVAARVGFTSTNGFILAFRRHFAQTPGAFAAEHRLS